MIRKIITFLFWMSVTASYAQYGDFYYLQVKADSGDVNAMKELAKKLEDYSYVKGSTIYYEPKYAEALKWYLKAQAAGSKDVQYSIGRYYHNGYGTSVDLDKAIEYYEKAIEYGNGLNPAVSIGRIYQAEKNYEKAIEYYKVGIERDEIGAHFYLAELYLFGEGIRQDYQEAFRLYAKCCAYDSDAAFRIAKMYYNGLGTSVSYPEAMKWFKYSVQFSGCIWRGEAMRMIGHMYQDGLGVEKDYSEAKEWYQKAIKKEDDALSMVLLGDMYLYGLGEDADVEKAKRLYEKSVDHGEIRGMRRLASLYKYFYSDGTKAMEYYKKAALSGDIPSNFLIGLLYATEEYGLEKNEEKAFSWYLKAAIAGDIDGMLLVGSCYYSGSGVGQNYQSAMNWWKKAIEKSEDRYAINGIIDDCDAMNGVGVLYYKGLGVSQNYKEAYEWFVKASEKGNVYATGYLGEMYYHGHYVKKDYNKAFTLLKESAEKKGASTCMRLLSACYRYGLGTSSDPEQEKYWMEQASKAGDDIAVKILSRSDNPEHFTSQ